MLGWCAHLVGCDVWIAPSTCASIVAMRFVVECHATNERAAKMLHSAHCCDCSLDGTFAPLLVEASPITLCNT